ncbi:MAG TPA: P-loop NTPase fold protein, partial [Acidimicrobiales bacterium]
DREPVLTVSDRVELQDDVPGEQERDDRLRRMPLARALAQRLVRRHEEGRERSFLVHLDGPWGSGKTTVLNFVAGCLGPDWTVVRYNAWRQSRIGPQWWTLLTALRAEVLRRRSRLGRAWLWLKELWLQRVVRTSGWAATVFVVLVALGIFLAIRPHGATAKEVLTTFDGIAATGVGVATLFAGAQVVGRFFGWHSPRGAKAFQDLDTNPMDRVAEHFSWLVRQERRPIALFIDDVDRCPATDVVELLESVQTLVRDAGDERGEASDVLSPCVVVAGDGAWIRNAFEEHYREFTGQIAEPGRPLGYLFLAKIFQLTVPVPRIGPVRQAAYFRELLGLVDPDGVDPATADPDTVKEAEQRVRAAKDDDAQQRVLLDLPAPVREAVAPVAVERQTEQAFADATEHRLTGFAELLPDNPRAVKRFLNAFALNRTVRTLEGQAVPTPTLALWTILEIRWPQLADALTAHPGWVEAAGANGGKGADGGPDDDVPAEIRELLADPDVQAVLHFGDGGPLTSSLVQACRGG